MKMIGNRCSFIRWKKKYVPCGIEWNGVHCDRLGLRTKGNSTLVKVADAGSDRYSFKMEFDHFDEGNLLCGLDKLILNNIHGDPSYLVEYMAYLMYEHIGVKTPYFAFVHISVNGKPWGLYLAIEGVEDAFVERAFTNRVKIYKPENSLIEHVKKEKDVGWDDDGGADLVYRDDQPSSYPNIFERDVFHVDDEDKRRVIQALKSLKEDENKEKCVDVDACLRYFAALTFTNNPDSYYNRFVCNYYLLEDKGILSMLPWDLNRSFHKYEKNVKKILSRRRLTIRGIFRSVRQLARFIMIWSAQCFRS